MLEVADLSKAYGRKLVIDNLSFTVESGEVVAVVGPNGAGKSTLFNILAGIIERSSGSVLFDSEDLADLPQGDMGFLSEELFFYDRFTAAQTLEFEGVMRQVGQHRMNLQGLIELFDIGGFLHERMDSLSQGMAKRVLLAAAFLGSPRLLLLDEPLNGLDIQSVAALKQSLAAAKQTHTHVLISSNVLSFLDEIADRVLYLEGGRLVATSYSKSAQAEQVYRQLFMKGGEYHGQS